MNAADSHYLGRWGDAISEGRKAELANWFTGSLSTQLVSSGEGAQISHMEHFSGADVFYLAALALAERLQESIEIAEFDLKRGYSHFPDLIYEDIDVPNLHLSNANLAKADLREANLCHCDLMGAILDDADLSCSNLTRANLSGVSLRRANLANAKLLVATLEGAQLEDANLVNADLEDANLSQTSMTPIQLAGVKLAGANLESSIIPGADFRGCDLTRVNFRGATLVDSNFSRTSLYGANFSGALLAGSDFAGAMMEHAKLVGADLYRARMDEAILTGANLHGANLIEASLRRALLRNADLSQTRLSGSILNEADFEGADLRHANVYGVAAWGVNLQDARQTSLVISASDEPEITVDNVEVAQFIYLLMHNVRIRQVIDTIAKKLVLVLGRFTPERKQVLDAIRDALRTHDYLPVVFDFEKPESRDLTETVSTLAHLARFVVADLTSAKSIPQELERIVPHLPSVAVQPIIEFGNEEYAMFEHLKRYPWVLTAHHYRDIEHLLATLQSDVIGPAERCADLVAPHAL